MPYAIFCYPPEEEFAVRAETRRLRTRLEQRGKQVTTISACPAEFARRSQGPFPDDIQSGLNLGKLGAVLLHNTPRKSPGPDDAVVRGICRGDARSKWNNAGERFSGAEIERDADIRAIGGRIPD